MEANLATKKFWTENKYFICHTVSLILESVANINICGEGIKTSILQACRNQEKIQIREYLQTFHPVYWSSPLLPKIIKIKIERI